METPSSSLYGLTLLLSAAVRNMIQLKGGYDFTGEPVFVEKKIVQFHRRMRVDGLEKFGARTVFSAVKFYTSVETMERDEALGVLVVFVEADYLSRLLWSLDYPRIDEDDDAAILDGCGTLANLIAGYFVKEIYDAGYIHLQMSHFESYINTAVNGISFCPGQDRKYEARFLLQGDRRVTAELTMGPVPRVS